MVTIALSDANAAALKQLADEAGLTVDQLLSGWIARLGAPTPTPHADREERERRLRELNGKYDFGDPELSLKVGEVMREMVASKQDRT